MFFLTESPQNRKKSPSFSSISKGTPCILLFEQMGSNWEPRGKTPSEGDIQIAHLKKLRLLEKRLTLSDTATLPLLESAQTSKQLLVFKLPMIRKFWLAGRALKDSLCTPSQLKPGQATCWQDWCLILMSCKGGTALGEDGDELEEHLLQDGDEVEGEEPPTANFWRANPPVHPEAVPVGAKGISRGADEASREKSKSLK